MALKAVGAAPQEQRLHGRFFDGGNRRAELFVVHLGLIPWRFGNRVFGDILLFLDVIRGWAVVLSWRPCRHRPVACTLLSPSAGLASGLGAGAGLMLRFSLAVGVLGCGLLALSELRSAAGPGRACRRIGSRQVERLGHGRLGPVQAGLKTTLPLALAAR